MADTPELPPALTKEVGAGKLKLPLWLWGVAGVGGLYIARAIKNRNAKATATSSTDTTGADLNAGSDSAFGGGLGANGAVVVGGGGFDSTTSTTLTDNDAWRKAAENYLVSANYDALAAARAIDRYLAGDPLTRAQQIMVEAALRRLGPTPETVPAPIASVPAPKPPPPPPPPTPKPKPAPGAIQQDHALHFAKAPTNPAEHFVDFANTSNGAGTWWLTNLGGVYTAGTAPYFGSPIGAGDRRADWQTITTRWPGKGYTCSTVGGAHVRSFS